MPQFPKRQIASQSQFFFLFCGGMDSSRVASIRNIGFEQGKLGQIYYSIWTSLKSTMLRSAIQF